MKTKMKLLAAIVAISIPATVFADDVNLPTQMMNAGLMINGFSQVTSDVEPVDLMAHPFQATIGTAIEGVGLVLNEVGVGSSAFVAGLPWQVSFSFVDRGEAHWLANCLVDMMRLKDVANRYFVRSRSCAVVSSYASVLIQHRNLQFSFIVETKDRVPVAIRLAQPETVYSNEKVEQDMRDFSIPMHSLVERR